MFGFLGTETMLEMGSVIGFFVGATASMLLGMMALVVVSRRLKALQHDNVNIHAKLNDIRLASTDALRIAKEEAQRRLARHEERMAHRQLKRERREAFHRGMEAGRGQGSPFGEAREARFCQRVDRPRRRRKYEEDSQEETRHSGS